MTIKGIECKTSDGVENIDINGYGYGLITELSGVRLVAAPAENGFEISAELLEARLFDSDSELYIWREGDRFKARKVKDTDLDERNYIDAKPIAMTGAVSRNGFKIMIRKYIDYDEDGQAYIALTRLCGVAR